MQGKAHIVAPAIAVHRLNARHRDDIARHLLQLPADDRRLRFGNQIGDQAVRDYVAGIDFQRDRVFGTFAAGMDLVGVAHLALDRAEKIAELGVSVDPAMRGQGNGFALLQRAALHAANVGYRVLFMICLAENGIMMHLAKKAGLTVVVEHGEADARLKLDRVTHGGIFREALADQFALVDALLKQHYLWADLPGLQHGAARPAKLDAA
jgi:GNAT superfamily N-acetyltransferase